MTERAASDAFEAIVLAAGKGTRMKSPTPKVLHEVAEKPLVSWVVEAALEAGAVRVIVVVGHEREAVEEQLQERFGDAVVTALQAHQRGTGDAVLAALPKLSKGAKTAVILYGDCPLIPGEDIQALVNKRGQAPLSLLVSELDNPTGYGRILRNQGHVTAIREEKDCSEAERQIREVNPGLYAVDAAFLRTACRSLTSNNAAGELYLTDLVAQAAAAEGVVALSRPITMLLGINTQRELATAEAHMQDRIAARHGEAGVCFRHRASTWIGAQVELEAGVVLEPHTILRGKTRVQAGARIDAGAVLEDANIGANCWIKPYTVVSEATVEEGAQVGPFAHLRSGTQLGPRVRVGNFVETKKTTMAEGAKASHLSYLGDAVIGPRANIGAGTIFCNYDGVNKHTTTIEEDAFVGSDCQLVAPVTVGRGSYIATGTTVTRNVPEDALAVGRAKQENKEGYAKRLRARFGAKRKD